MKILEAILNGLDERKNGETTIFYNCQLANEDETRGRKRALSPMIPLVQLRSKSHVKNLVYLNFRGDINIILTWIIMHFASQVKRNMPNSKGKHFQMSSVL